MAMVTAAVEPKRRGSFLSINASVQQLSAGVASLGAGFVLGKIVDRRYYEFRCRRHDSAITSIACVVLARNLTH